MCSSLIRFSIRWFPPSWGELGGETGERREGIGGEEGGVQEDGGTQDDPSDAIEGLWDPGAHVDQAGGSVNGGEGGPGFAFDMSTLEKLSLAADEEENVVPIMVKPGEVHPMPFMPREEPDASKPCLMLCWELPSRGLLSLKTGE